jgi:hypothetical protein
MTEAGTSKTTKNSRKEGHVCLTNLKNTFPYTNVTSKRNLESGKPKDRREKKELSSGSKKSSRRQSSSSVPSNSIVLHIQEHIDAVCGKSYAAASNESASYPGIEYQKSCAEPTTERTVDAEGEPCAFSLQGSEQERGEEALMHQEWDTMRKSEEDMRNKEMLALRRLVEQSQIMLADAESRASVSQVVLLLSCHLAYASIVILAVMISRTHVHVFTNHDFSAFRTDS